MKLFISAIPFFLSIGLGCYLDVVKDVRQPVLYFVLGCLGTVASFVVAFLI